MDNMTSKADSNQIPLTRPKSAKFALLCLYSIIAYKILLLVFLYVFTYFTDKTQLALMFNLAIQHIIICLIILFFAIKIRYGKLWARH